jgi:trk system potassium uptake protein
MRQIAVIGLGNFGHYLGRELYLKGYDVMGIDIRQDIVQKVKDEFSEVVIADATDKDTLLALGIDRVDLAVVAIGTNMLASILTTFHLKEIGVKKVFAKALSEEHQRILDRIGADEILFPERDLAVNVAQRIHNPNLLEYLPTIEDYGIFELDHTRLFVGKSLRDLDLINKYGVQVIAIRDRDHERLAFIPRGNYVIEESDVLVLLGPSNAMQELTRKME